MISAGSSPVSARLPSGSRLGPYEITAWTGAGGMGEVYKARDTRLNRTVAIKVLPARLSGDPDFRQLLQREAKAVSALSDSHICTLYDIGDQDGIAYLVMEYLDGETLAARLRKGPLAIKGVLRYGIEIAHALAVAHRAGIVHRDLKPGNIMLTKSGAKLLDFGLAKVAPVLGDVSEAATQTDLNQVGSLFGTLLYMSPEQVQGKPADARSDLFSFGTVLYEMASGRPPFAADTQAGVIAAILDRDPEPPSNLNPNVPPALEKLIGSCLVKDREERQQNAHDAAQILRWIDVGALNDPSWAPRRRSRERILFWGALSTLLVAVLALSFLLARHVRPELSPVRFQILGPPGSFYTWFDMPAISPDGRHLVFSAQGSSDVKPVLWLRSMESMALKALAGTEDGSVPFWSPDSRHVAFVANGKLKKIDLAGGPPQILCETDQFGSGGSWSSNGTVLLGSDTAGLQRVSAQGGIPQNVLQLDKAAGELHQRWPQFLPDGNHFLYLSSNANPEKSGIRVGSLDSPETRMVLPGRSRAVFVPPGYLVFARNKALMAQAFDAKKLKAEGSGFVIADAVAYSLSNVESGLALFSASDNGVLVWRSEDKGKSQIVSFSRDGRPLGPVGEAGDIQGIGLSPDEKYLAVIIRNAADMHDIWVVNVASGIFSRVTSDPGGSENPVWSPNSGELVFASIRNLHHAANVYYNLYRKRVGGPPESIFFESGEPKFPTQWLPDGSVIFSAIWSKNFYRLPLAGERKPELLFHSEFDKNGPLVSPDGRWATYAATDSGRWEVYVASYPRFNDLRQVSSDGGNGPLWGKKGRELYYQAKGKVMVVDIQIGRTLETSKPRELFAMPPSEYDVTSDGRRFFVLQKVDDSPSSMNVMLNWTASLSRGDH